MRKITFPVQRGNGHLDKLLEHFGKLDDGTFVPPADIAFTFLCYTNRCGSNYVAELISSSGQYNLAGEDLNWDTVINNSVSNNIGSFHGYFHFLTQRLMRSGRVFIKIAFPHIEVLGKSGILDQIIGKTDFVLIERNDKLSQSISHALAFGTGRFTSWMTGTKSPEDIAYSESQLNNIIAAITEQYRQFDMFFAKNGLIPFCLLYEQMLIDPDIYLAALSRHLGVESLQIKHEALRLKQQSSSVNSEWRDRYLANSE